MKREQFKRLVARHGQTLSWARFKAAAAAPGAMVDGWPDPEDPDYPADDPQDQYEPSVSVLGFVQPPGTMRGGESRTLEVAGIRTETELVAYLPYDIAVGHRDKLTWNGRAFLVGRIKPWYDEGTELIYNEVELAELESQVSAKP